jgi:hypothetical protein
MLEACAPGATYRMATHSRVVEYNGRRYPSLPKHDNLEVGEVRKMARHLGFLDCAKDYLKI